MSQQINLYNAAFRPRRELLNAQSLTVAALALLVVVGAAAGWTQHQAKARTAEMLAAQAEQTAALARLEAVRLAANARKPSAALQAEIASKKTLLAMRDEVLAVLQDGMGGANGLGFSEYLRGLARQSVNGLWLTGFAVSAGGGDMSLSGKTIDKSLLPDYVRRLNSEKAFAGKTFSGLRMDAKGGDASPGDVKSIAVPLAPTFSAAPGIVTPAAIPAATPVAAPAIASWIEFQLAAKPAAEATKP